ncbi:uncharacterized protein LOC123704519 [Colias croceus]|uniref:uncharacterized protein LOC123704519 n=1 Tax=Colias crocea TaxID=72248 RepID=UPI001E279F4D|nr:uncharacterized protein LOC123704519 [Colias croceus]
MIAEKTIEGIIKLQNSAFNKDNTQKTEATNQNNDVYKIRRDSFTLISKEHENNVNSNSLSDLTLKYKKLIGNIKKDPAKLEIWSENETTTDTKDKDSIAKTKDNLDIDVNAKDDNPEIIMNETEEKQNDSDESESGDVIEDEEHEAKKITEKEIIQTDATTPEDIFSSKQKDLHGKKTVREEGDKMFVFQSSSEYEEYHDKVNEVMKSGP